MTEDLPDLFNQSDYTSVELEISLLNTTTQTQIKGGKRMFGDREHRKKGVQADTSVRLIEFIDEGFVLEVPPHSGAKGHAVELEVKVLNSEKDIHLKATGSIAGTEQLDNQKFRFEIKLSHYDERVMEDLLGLYNNRQQEILEYFKSVKGFE